MGFDDGEVLLNNANHTYYTGQEITGVLKFHQDKLKTFRGLYVKLKGCCKVLWTTTTGSGNKRRRVRHENYEEYMNKRIYLVGGSTGECTIGIGTHEYPFSFQLPHDCPSSFEGAHGQIYYHLKVVVDRSMRPDQEKKIPLHVISPVDLNLDPYSRHPIDLEISASYCCWCITSGGCELQVRAPCSGFCPGQTIPLDVSLKSFGSTSINEIIIKIKEKTTFFATDSRTRSDETTIQKVKKGPIDANASRNWIIEMPVPNIVVRNFTKCGPIDVQYRFKVTVVPSGLHGNESKSWPIIIGTLPLLPMEGNMQNPINQIHQVPIQFIPLSDHSSSPIPYPYPVPGNPPYPTTNSPYPGTNSAQPGSNPPYPSANPPNPGMHLPQLNSNCPYPSPNPPKPGINLAQLNPNSPYPSPNPPNPGINLSQLNPNSPYPSPNPTNPGINLSQLNPNSPYPSPNPPNPGINLSQLNPNSPYPSPNPTNPGINLSQMNPNSPYPSPNPPNPGINLPPLNLNSPYPSPNPPNLGNNLPQLNPNSPYPSPNPPYPGMNVPQTNSNPPYPVVNVPQLGPSPPYPSINVTQSDPSPPYPGGNISKPDSPGPGSLPPYPVANSPQPGTNTYAPNSDSKASISNDFPNPPYPIDPKPQMGAYDTGSNRSYGNSPSLGLKTGRLGFVGQDSAQMPLLPQGAMSGVLRQSPNPFADASAPDPGTPKKESNEDAMQNESLLKSPAFNLDDAENDKKE